MKPLNDFETSLEKLYGSEKYQVIINARVGIAGCGGLGSNVASFLVRSGFRKLKLVDFDNVEVSNLNRQMYFYDQIGRKKSEVLAENLKKINPSLELEVSIERIEKGNIKNIFSRYPIIIEAFDKPEYKSMLVRELIQEKELIVSASGLCGIGSSDDIITKRVKDNFWLVGDFVTSLEKSPPFAPKVNIAAAKQADIVLEYVLR